MLGMQLTIGLGVVCDVDRVREHVTDCVRRLNRRRDLVHASCLVDEDERLCAPLYVWRNEGAMCGFLLGDPFTCVVEALGRPRVRTWNVLAFDCGDAKLSPGFAVREIDALDAENSLASAVRREDREHRAKLALPGLHTRAVMLDPTRWEIARFTLWRDQACAVPSDADCVETYRVNRFYNGANPRA